MLWSLGTFLGTKTKRAAAKPAAGSVRKRRLPFLKNTSGAAALEFAIVGPIHLGLMLGMLETGFILAKDAMLDLGISEATKQVYIGALASDTVSINDIRENVCKYVSVLQPGCEDDLVVELTKIDNFNAPPSESALCSEQKAAGDIDPKVEKGTSSDVMYLRVCLTTDIFFPGLGWGLSMSKNDGGQYELITATAFQNEPF